MRNVGLDAGIYCDRVRSAAGEGSTSMSSYGPEVGFSVLLF